MRQRISNAILAFVTNRYPQYNSFWLGPWMLFVFLVSYLVYWHILPQPDREIKRVVFLGSACDPFHDGHLAVIRFILFCLSFDEIRFYPYGFAEWKESQAPTADRLKLIFASIPGWWFDSPFLPKLDVNPDDMVGEPRRTWVVYQYLQGKYDPGTEIVFITGTDTITPTEKLKGQTPLEQFENLNVILSMPTIALTRRGCVNQVNKVKFPKVEVVHVLLPDTSSTLMREWIFTHNHAWRKRLTPRARRLIDKTGMYQKGNKP